MASKTGPIRSQIGPLRANLGKNQQAVKDLLDKDADIELDDLIDLINDMNVAYDKFEAATRRLRNKHDEWTKLVMELATEAEQSLYDDKCNDIMELLLDCDDLLTQLHHHIALLQRRHQRKTQTAVHANQVATPVSSLQASQSGATPLQVQSQPVSNATIPPAPNPQPPQAAPVRPHSTAFKAPKINLPTFSGNYMEFKQFWGIFEANIDSHPNLTNIEKFTYLLGQLRGDARLSLADLLISNDNYDVAIGLLKSRYDRADDRLITMLYSELSRISTSSGKLPDKQRTLDECERIFRQLETTGEDVNANKSLVISLLSKFPSGMVRDLQRYYGVGANSTLKEVREGLQRSIIADETTSGVLDDLQSLKVTSGRDNQNHHQGRENQSFQGRNQNSQRGPQLRGDNSGSYTFYSKSYQDPANPKPPRDSTMATTARPFNGPNRPPQNMSPNSPCYFCEGSHFNGDCTAYPSAQARKYRLAQVNRCTHCMLLKKNHVNGRCPPVTIKCVFCKTDGDHRGPLCFVQYPNRLNAEHASASGTPSRNNTTTDPNTVTGITSGPPTAPATKSSAPTNGGMVALNHADVKPALFQTAQTTAVNPKTGQQCVLRLALDTLSSRSYITESAAHKLGLTTNQGENEKLLVSVFGSNKTLEVPTTRVEFDLTFQNSQKYRVEANTTRVICRSGANLNSWSEQERNALAVFEKALADDPYDHDGTIDVLIGATLVWDFIQGPRIPTLAPNLFLIPSKFGLMLSGEAERESDTSLPTMLCITDSPCRFPSELGLVACESKLEPTYPDIDEFWNLEKIGISDDPVENDDDKAIENFEQTIKCESGRYEVTLPWIDEKRDRLPANYDVAYDRLRSLTKRLKSNPELLQGYRDTFRLQLERGIIEQVPDDEIDTENVTHYLPHHAVIKPTSNTTKIRIVFDAAAKKNRKNLSLNECLQRGPVILPDLCQLLMRMRIHETVVISDIEKAFLQVGLQKPDRDVTRFLWLKDDTNLGLIDNIAIYRFGRVTFGVICSPFLLAATLNHHLTVENTPFAASLKDDIYVDNVITGLDSQDDPLEYYQKLKALFERASMNIQEFCSNSPLLMRTIPETDRVKQPDAKVLGMRWDSQGDDTLRLSPPTKLDSCTAVPTKRAALQAISSVFDPLGFFQPVLLPAKCFLQKLWNLKYGWDDALPDNLKDEWNTLRDGLQGIASVRIPRYIGKLDEHASLAVFCDASAKAYATAVYLRCRQPNGEWSAHLIFSKSRLSPSFKNQRNKGDKHSIGLPRLELLGAVIGVRAGQFCRDGLKDPNLKIDFFIDSQSDDADVNLHPLPYWIRSRGLLKRFVANRVDEIRKVTNCEFHYVNTKENPADLGTRGRLTSELVETDLWWHGPSWLKHEPESWPKTELPPITDTIIQQIECEVQPRFFGQTLAVPVATPSLPFLAVNPENFSNLRKMVRLSAICLKFLKRRIWSKLSSATQDAKPALQRLFQGISDDSHISCTDYDTAKHQWVKSVQQEHYTNILEVLSAADPQQSKSKRPQMIDQLGLQLDENGIIRATGRFEHADLPDEAKCPILLPKTDRFTTLLIEDVHASSMHSGVSHTLSLVRLKYWIPHGRALVRRIVKSCLVCRRYKAAPFKLPPMPPWPQERVARSAPFQATGLDYFGPINVRVGGTQSKMWVCLFTCLTTRAVHLEPVMDFSAKEFLHCLIRFVSRRGVPNTIISDNAAQFQLVKILGDQAWKRTPTDESVLQYAASQGIRWKFITELAPWQGGFYERLVGLVKSTMRSSIRRKLLSWTDLVTLLTEAEAVVNSRPITYVGDDIESRFSVLRPVDFLIQQASALSDSADGSEVRAKDYGEAGKLLVSVWKQRCRTLDKLWKSWYDNYLLSLRERRIVSHKAGRSDVDKIPLLQQIVMVCDSDAPRGRWKLGRITQLLPGRDGHIRAAELILSNGFKLRRALNHLVPLEVEQPAPEVDPEQSSSIEDGATPESNQPAPVLPHGQGVQPLPPSDEEDAENNAPVQHVDEYDNDTDANDDFFYGYSADDVQRAANALQRFDDLSDEVSNRQ